MLPGETAERGGQRVARVLRRNSTRPTGDTEIRDVGRPWWKGDAREAEVFGDRDEIAKLASVKHVPI